MRNTFILLIITLFMGTWLQAQVKIGDNPQNIDPSSVLELESTDKVLVITRVTTTQMNAIVPSQGALCYNTDLQAVHFYDGTQWVNIGSSGTSTGGPLTADPIVNDVSTIVISPTATGDNLEVAPNSISSLQIIDGGINGIDIQDGSIGPGKLQNNSVTEDKLSENSVGAFALDNDNIGVSAFNNDVGYLTAGDLGSNVSVDTPNSITAGSDGGAFYDDTNLMNDVLDNSMAIAMDDDQNPTNELQNLIYNATTNILTLSTPATTGNEIDLSGLASGGGSDDQNIGPLSLSAANVLSIGIEDGMAGTVDLSSLAGATGGSNNTAFDVANDSLRITDAGGTLSVPLTSLGSGGTNQNASQVPFAPYLTIAAIDTQAAVEELKPLAGLAAATGGSNNTDFTIANDSLNITDGVGTLSVPLAGLAAATGGSNNIDFIVANDSLNITDGNGTLSVALSEIASAAGGSDNTDFSIANDSLNITDGAGSLGIPLSSLGTPNTLFEIINDSLNLGDAVDTLKIAIADIGGNNIAFEIANDSLIIEDAGARLGIPVDSIAHSGTPMSLFYADATTGLPTTAFNPNAGGTIITRPSLVWDQSKRVGSGALGIGLDGGAMSDNAKVHIMEGGPFTLNYPLQIQRQSGVANEGVGILFAVEAQGNFGKGSLAFERTAAWGVGDFHFLQNVMPDTLVPTLADKSFTITSDKNIKLYGNLIDINDIGALPAGTPEEGWVLTNTAAGTAWAAAGGLPAATIDGQVLTWDEDAVSPTEGAWVAGASNLQSVALDIADDEIDILESNGLTASSSVKLDGITLEAANDGTNDVIRIKPATLPTVDPITQVLTTDNVSGDVEWADFSGASIPMGTAGSIFFSDGASGLVDNPTNLFWNNTDNRLGIGTNTPSSALEISGETRSTSFAAPEGTADEPSYGFTTGTDTNTGIYRPAADEIGFTTGGQDALRVDEYAAGSTQVLVDEKLGIGFNLTADTGYSGVDVNSTIQINGSMATKITTNSGAVALGIDDHTIIFNANGSIMLPAANSCEGRIYIIKNPSFTVTSSIYDDSFGVPKTVINGVIWLQSDGSNWQQIN